MGPLHTEVLKGRAGGSRKKRELKLELPIPWEMQQRRKDSSLALSSISRTQLILPGLRRGSGAVGKEPKSVSAVPSWKPQGGCGASKATPPLLGWTLHTAGWQPKPKNILFVKKSAGVSYIPLQQEIGCDSLSLTELGVSLLNRGCHHGICSMTASSQIPWENQAFPQAAGSNRAHAARKSTEPMRENFSPWKVYLSRDFTSPDGEQGGKFEAALQVYYDLGPKDASRGPRVKPWH